MYSINNSNVFCACNYSTLKEMVPSFNECVDQFLEKLRSMADGKSKVPMKEHISDLTNDVISKVITGMCTCLMTIAGTNITSKVAFSSDFTKQWAGKYLGMKHSSSSDSLHSIIALCFTGIQKQFQSVLPYHVRNFMTT